MDCYTPLIQQLNDRIPSLELREWEPMARHTTFRIGGPVRLMALPCSVEEAQGAVQVAHTLGISPLFVGNGSNLLVSDQGVDAFVIKCTGLKELSSPAPGQIIAGSGVLLSQLANYALSLGLTGLEFAHGIPGTVGGGVTMNAGAYGGELCQVIVRTQALTPSGGIQTIEGTDHEFSYRHSAFSDGSRLILSTTLSLTPGNPEEIRARMDDLAQRRREKQPLELPSAGSTFKRPEGHFAAALIEQCGLKGVGIGGAQVSEKHSGFVVNRGGATADDVRQLMALVQETVLQKTGVALEPEVKCLGF